MNLFGQLQLELQVDRRIVHEIDVEADRILVRGQQVGLLDAQPVQHGDDQRDLLARVADQQDVELIAVGEVKSRGHRRCDAALVDPHDRSEEHTSELQSLMRISYAVFCLKKKIKK